MRGKAWLPLLFLLIVLGGTACSKKQAPSSGASQTPASQTPAPQGPAAAQPSGQQAGAAPAQPAPSTPAQTASGTPAANAPAAAPVPSGTALVVHLSNAISTKTAQAGDEFTGKVAKAVIVHGETAIPQGAEVTGRVAEVKSAGKLAGAAHLELKLTSVKISGQSYKISSNAFSQTSTGKGKRTAVMGGGGAGVGAIVGGVAGGKKGALIGGVAGAGAGTAGSAFTGNADITLPAESRLSFHLTRPLDLNQPTTLSSSK